MVFNWLYTIRPKVENFRRLGDPMVGSISGLASLKVTKTANTVRQKFIILSVFFGLFWGLFFVLKELGFFFLKSVRTFFINRFRIF